MICFYKKKRASYIPEITATFPYNPLDENSLIPSMRVVRKEENRVLHVI